MDLRQYLIDEFVEDYEQGHLSRRQAFRLLAGITGAATAGALLASAAPAEAQEAEPIPQAPRAGNSVPNRVAPDDPRVRGGAVLFAGADATLLGYMARPAAEGSYPIVLVCHENRGLTLHIQDVARRLAVAGYTAMAVDLLSREGGTAAANPDAIPGLLSNAPPERHVQDFQSGLAFMQAQSFANANRVGMVGFCFGGGITWRVAAATPSVNAAVPFYGPPVPVEQVPGIAAPVLAIYAERDERINQTIPTIEAAMQENGKTFEKVIYPAVDHAFHNDTGARYNAEASQDAWARTLEWFGRYLQG
jgi:carboxymethylenebutenolidase